MRADADSPMRRLAMRLSTSTSQSKKVAVGSSYSSISPSAYPVCHWTLTCCSDETRKKHCISAPFPNAGEIDRLEKAREHGCNVASTSSLDGLTEILKQWGVDGSRARMTIEQYDRIMRCGDKTPLLDSPVGKGGIPPAPLVEGKGPFFAMEVQPSYVECSLILTLSGNQY